MGQGAQFVLLNATNNPWTIVPDKTSKYQMNAWVWQPTIQPGESYGVYFEFENGVFTTSSDDAGVCVYTINDSNKSSFMLRAIAPASDFQILVHPENFALSPALDQGKEIVLAHYKPVPSMTQTWNYGRFIVSGTQDNYIGTRPPSSWMHTMLPTIGTRKLRNLCLPGSHDSGMSTVDNGSSFSNILNTQTQRLDIAGQLDAGIRCFDIRPTVLKGQYSTGHFSDAGGLIGVQGGYGQSIGSIITQINAFTAQNKELVILCFSHSHNMNDTSKLTDFSQEDWEGLLGLLQSLKCRSLVDSNSSDVSNMRVSDFIGSGVSSIVCTVPDGSVDLSKYPKQSFVFESQLPYWKTSNSYWSNTDDAKTLSTQQTQSLNTYRRTPDAPIWLVQWILTLEGLENVNTDSIAANTFACNHMIFSDLWKVCTKNSYPSAIVLDMVDSDLTALCIAINNFFGSST